jgi:hypothetical protein
VDAEIKIRISWEGEKGDRVDRSVRPLEVKASNSARFQTHPAPGTCTGRLGDPMISLSEGGGSSAHCTGCRDGSQEEIHALEQGCTRSPVLNQTGIYILIVTVPRRGSSIWEMLFTPCRQTPLPRHTCLDRVRASGALLASVHRLRYAEELTP